MQLMLGSILSNDEDEKDPNTRTSVPPLIEPNAGNIDEIDTSEALKEVLGEEGYICSIVSSSTDARRAMEQQPFDLLLTDVVMPGEGGIELSHWAIIRHQ